MYYDLFLWVPVCLDLHVILSTCLKAGTAWDTVWEDNKVGVSKSNFNDDVINLDSGLAAISSVTIVVHVRVASVKKGVTIPILDDRLEEWFLKHWKGVLYLYSRSWLSVERLQRINFDLIFGLSDPCDMKKRICCVFRKFDFYAFY